MGHARALHMVSLETASLMCCVLPMMHCRFQHCWALLHQLHTTANSDATTPNIIGPIFAPSLMLQMTQLTTGLFQVSGSALSHSLHATL